MKEEEALAYEKQVMRAFIEAIDQVPYGQFIPSNWQPPEGFSYEKFNLEGAIVEHLVPKAKTTDIVILHIHGGGYAMSLVDAYREGSLGYSNIAGGAEVFNVDYRTAPTYTYPAALDDCVKAYQWLLDQGYKNENIIFIGDSAGGNAVLATTLYLKDHNLPLPKGIIAISPWASLEFNLPSRTINIDNDLLIGNNASKMLEEVKNPSYVGENDIKNPYLSPIYGEYAGFPPLLIQNGSHEILLDDGRLVYEKAKAAGVKVRYTMYKGMSHDFQLLLLDLPESQAAWKEMKEFVASLS